MTTGSISRLGLMVLIATMLAACEREVQTAAPAASVPASVIATPAAAPRHPTAAAVDSQRLLQADSEPGKLDVVWAHLQ